MKMILRSAAAAAALGALAFSPAQAADLGGGCCADLEERVAELEATTVRKGNRVVSVQLYGVVNRMLLVWDDGFDSDLFVVDNDLFSSRFGLTGSGSMKPGWTAGYRIEIEFQNPDGLSVFQADDDAGDDVNIRKTLVYIDSERLGRVTLGKQSMATDDLFYQYPGGTLETPVPFNDYSFRVRGRGSPADEVTDTSRHLVIGNFFGAGNIGDAANRQDAIRYDTPTFAGFTASAAFGDSDDIDAALRYQQTWNSVEVSAAIGYQFDPDFKVFNGDEMYIASAAFKHVPTGIWATAAYQLQDYGQNPFDGTVIEDDFSVDDNELYGFMIGISKNWTGHGDTTFHFAWGHGEDGGVGNAGFFNAGIVDDGIYLPSDGNEDIATSTEADRFNFGVAQNFDSASLQIYAGFSYYEFEADGVSPTVSEDGDLVSIGDVQEFDVEDFWTINVGSYITF